MPDSGSCAAEKVSQECYGAGAIWPFKHPRLWQINAILSIADPQVHISSRRWRSSLDIDPVQSLAIRYRLTLPGARPPAFAWLVRLMAAGFVPASAAQLATLPLTQHRIVSGGGRLSDKSRSPPMSAVVVHSFRLEQAAGSTGNLCPCCAILILRSCVSNPGQAHCRTQADGAPRVLIAAAKTFSEEPIFVTQK